MEQRRRSFLRMVSHELRTPLNTVIGFSEIIASELYGLLGTPEYKEYAEFVRQSGYRLLKLVNQVIEIARLEDGVVDLDLSGEPVGQAIDDIISALKDGIAAREVQIVVEDRDTLPIVRADGHGLRTMLLNLTQNALADSPQGGLISLRCRLGTSGMEIEDRGPGIEPSQLQRLLQPFEQGDEALTRSSEGAGMGLAITQLLARAMNGKLRLRSSVGAGFKATLVLPSA